jgi:heme/copper-type cytochrome/quinol oxidase subunit 2
VNAGLAVFIVVVAALVVVCFYFAFRPKRPEAEPRTPLSLFATIFWAVFAALWVFSITAGLLFVFARVISE